jgi:hypothetical protein
MPVSSNAKGSPPFVSPQWMHLSDNSILHLSSSMIRTAVLDLVLTQVRFLISRTTVGISYLAERRSFNLLRGVDFVPIQSQLIGKVSKKFAIILPERRSTHLNAEIVRAFFRRSIDTFEQWKKFLLVQMLPFDYLWARVESHQWVCQNILGNGVQMIRQKANGYKMENQDMSLM